MMCEKPGVVGAGVMGCGVAQALSEAGYDVVLADISRDILEQARRQIRQALRFRRMTGAEGLDIDAALARIRFTTDETDLSECTFVIENVTEDAALKEGIYRRLDKLCPPDCLFAPNTSTIPIRQLADVTSRAERFIGMHFMNPVPQKPAVEVIRSEATSQDTLDRTHSLLESMGKDWILVNDAPGFVSNRILMLTINEAIQLISEGVSSVEDVDRLFRSCFGHPMGPLQTADLIGLDTILLSLQSLEQMLGEKYRPCPLLVETVAAGRLGRKSGQGFYSY